MTGQMTIFHQAGEMSPGGDVAPGLRRRPVRYEAGLLGYSVNYYDPRSDLASDICIVTIVWQSIRSDNHMVSVQSAENMDCNVQSLNNHHFHQSVIFFLIQ